MIEERNSSDDHNYKNIRDVIGRLIGKKIVDITESDDIRPEASYVMLMFEDGYFLKFYCDEWGFNHNVEPGMDPVK